MHQRILSTKASPPSLTFSGQRVIAPPDDRPDDRGGLLTWVNSATGDVNQCRASGLPGATPCADQMIFYSFDNNGAPAYIDPGGLKVASKILSSKIRTEVSRLVGETILFWAIDDVRARPDRRRWPAGIAARGPWRARLAATRGRKSRRCRLNVNG